MLKLALMLGAMGAAFFAGGRTIYSALQLQVPFGTASKMTPDPANIWSWHDTVTLPRNATSKTFPVMVDFDNDSKMDTENRDLRVMITDVQVSYPQGTNWNWWTLRVTIRDGAGILWDMTPTWNDQQQRLGYETHFATPLALQVASSLEIELLLPNNQQAPQDMALTVNLIGRLVTL